MFSFVKTQTTVGIITGKYWLLLLLMLLYSLLYSPKDGDSFASLNAFVSYHNGVDTEHLHFESVYFTLMSIFSHSYVLWRLSVWGTATIMYIALMKHFKCDVYVAIFVWSVLGIQAFYYQRIALPVAMLFWAAILFFRYREQNKLNYLFLAIILFIGCSFFHRSMPIYMMVTVFVILLPNQKWAVLIAFILIPILISTVLSFASDYLSSASDNIQEWGKGYMDSSVVLSEANFTGTMYELIRWSPFAIMMLYCLLRYFHAPHTFSVYERFFLLFASTLYILYFVLQGLVAYSFAGKMKMQSILAMTIFLVIYLSNRKYLKSSRLYFIGAVIVYLLITLPSLL